MRYLLDTHALIWCLEDSLELPEKVRKEILNSNNKCYVSIASLWEIAIKIKLGKLTIQLPFDRLTDYLSYNNIELLPISPSHLDHLLTIDLHHRDPFDRMIIAQALSEQLTIITRDEHFSRYTDKLMWK